MKKKKKISLDLIRWNGCKTSKATDFSFHTTSPVCRFKCEYLEDIPFEDVKIS